jgi:hypothetical protein
MSSCVEILRGDYTGKVSEMLKKVHVAYGDYLVP